jgi:hypothetical protein
MAHYYINIPLEDEELIEYTPLNDLYQIPDLMGHVFSFLPSRDLFSVGLSCRHWRELTELDIIWKPRYEMLLKERYDIQLDQEISMGTYKQHFFNFSKATARFDFHTNKIRQLAYTENRMFPLVASLCRSTSIVELIFFIVLMFSMGSPIWLASLLFMKMICTIARSCMLCISSYFLLFSTYSKKRHYNLVCETGFTTASSTASRETLNKELMIITPFVGWILTTVTLAICSTLGKFSLASWDVIAYTYYAVILAFIFGLSIIMYVTRPYYRSDRRMTIVFAVWCWLQIFMGLQFKSVVEYMTTPTEGDTWSKVFGGLYSLTYICLMVFMNLTCRLRFNWRRLSTSYFMLGGMEVVLAWVLQFLWSDKSDDGWRSSNLFMILSLGMHFYNAVVSFFFAAFFKLRA